MGRISSKFWFVFIISLSLISDQSTKWIAKEFLERGTYTHIFGDIFRFFYLENSGAFLGAGMSWSSVYKLSIFIVLPLLMLSLMVFILFRMRQIHFFQYYAFAFIIGGALSNIWDRIFNNGHVIDFMNIGIGFFKPGIFNFADVYIIGGLLTVVAISFTEWRHFEKQRI